ncbi:MAG TPA: hydrogenase expression/formation protein HypE [Chthonomonadales bacterium]|nr:hydrogenase expression/formation protein HypE [Chthonomonadales bacterium]
MRLYCPVPLAGYETVLMAHGGGGRLMHQLIERVIGPAFANPILDARHDAADLHIGGARLAFTTDSYVVRPLFFPGGDIGKLAICGTVNDLAMAGATPLYVSVGLIVEEGLPMETLWRVLQSMSQAASDAGVQVATGDTKVVERGKGDGIYVNTAGIGIVQHALTIGPRSLRPGDVIVLSGDLGRHGMAVMAVREGLDFESEIESDCAPLHRPVAELLRQCVEVHFLRDLTRGGAASALVDAAESGGVHIEIDEGAVPVREDVRGACEILGFDPLFVANEGRFLVAVPERDADRAVSILRGFPDCANACVAGRISAAPAGQVTMRTPLGVPRIVDMLSGEQLPRIC